MTLVDGPRRARAQLILAHGAGAPMDSPFMQTIAEGVAKQGIRVVRFEFPYMQARRAGRRPPPDRMPVLSGTFLDVVEKHRHDRLVIGGKSMGGRVAATIASQDIEIAGVVCLGYPFHPTGQPGKLRLEPLTAAKHPVHIVQGTRDPFGSKLEVARYELPERVQLTWLEDGDHSFLPRKSSGHTEAEHLASAVAAIVRFIDKGA